MVSEPLVSEPVASEPVRSVEIELKLDVDEQTPLPRWAGLAPVAAVSAPESRELDTRYLDTAGGRLAAAGIALRRREGGPDEGWHLKGPLVDGGRVEVHWPLGASGRPPRAVREEAARMASAPDVLSQPLVQLARIRTRRRAVQLCDETGGVIAEFCDDRVSAHSAHAGRSAWREWELELGPAAPDDPQWRAEFFARARQLMRATGARDAASGSKLARALGR